MGLSTLLRWSLVVLVLAGCSLRDATEPKHSLRISGSSNLRPVVERLIEGFHAIHPTIRVEHLAPIECAAVLPALDAEAIDVGYRCNEPQPEERAGFYLYPFAADPLVFAAHTGTGLSGLSTRQVRDLFRGRIGNWAELDGADLPVILLDMQENTCPKEILQDGLLASLEVCPEALSFDRSALVNEGLDSYPGALGYTSLRFALELGGRVDVLSLDGVYPDAETVRSGAYRLNRLATFAAPRNLSPAAKEFLDYAASPEAQRIIANHAMVPIRREMLIAVPPVDSILDIETRYGALARYLQDSLGRPVELLHQPTYTDLVEGFRANLVDAAFVGSFSYLLAHNELGVEVLARPESDDVSHYRGVIYVRTDAPYDDLADLAGARVAHAGRGTTAGYLFPTYALRTRGLPPPEQFFGSFVAANSHEAALNALLEGQVDAAALKDLVFESAAAEEPELRARVRPLARSLPVPSNGFAVGPLVDPALKKQLRRLLLNLDLTPRGRKALEDMGAQRFIPTGDDDYGTLYQMVAGVEADLADYLHYR